MFDIIVAGSMHSYFILQKCTPIASVQFLSIIQILDSASYMSNIRKNHKTHCHLASIALLLHRILLLSTAVFAIVGYAKQFKSEEHHHCCAHFTDKLYEAPIVHI